MPWLQTHLASAASAIRQRSRYLPNFEPAVGLERASVLFWRSPSLGAGKLGFRIEGRKLRADADEKT